MNKMPSLFISHGPPFVALADCPAQRFFKALGGHLPTPKGIVSVSAHWESVHPMVTAGVDPGLVYDFGGPRALKPTRYRLGGAPRLAEEITQRLQAEGIAASEFERGFDHGTWIPLMLMYPEGGIPVVQLSIQTEADAAHHHRLGNALAPLRHAGILIMASGGAVHNLDEISDDGGINAQPPAYVRRFDRWLEDQIIQGREAGLLDYQRHAPDPDRCHPYPAEHFLPLFVALGAADGAKGRRLHDSFLLGTLSMAAYAW